MRRRAAGHLHAEILLSIDLDTHPHSTQSHSEFYAHTKTAYGYAHHGEQGIQKSQAVHALASAMVSADNAAEFSILETKFDGHSEPRRQQQSSVQARRTEDHSWEVVISSEYEPTPGRGDVRRHRKQRRKSDIILRPLDGFRAKQFEEAIRGRFLDREEGSIAASDATTHPDLLCKELIRAAGPGTSRVLSGEKVWKAEWVRGLVEGKLDRELVAAAVEFGGDHCPREHWSAYENFVHG